ncbi:MAG: mycothiol system anti-sigma-R factor [Acidimicrobiales bacterium]|nr:mycothiol system anti-sigma-R factor [Acidimicrobiales bacterium]
MTSGSTMDAPDPHQQTSQSLDCQQALDRLYRFLDGQLDDARKDAIRHHLDSCGHCLEAFSFEAELKTVIARRAVTPVPPGLKDRIAEQLRRSV